MNEGARRFCTVFPNYRDLHFFKDPGQIPYRFSKIGYNTSLVCYNDGSGLPESEKHLKIIKIKESWFSRRFNSGIINYLLRNGGKIDILHVFHLSWSSLLFVYLYKLVNREGFAYLKLDDCAFSGWMPWETDFPELYPENRGNYNLKRRIKSLLVRKWFVRHVDLWSIEDEYSRELYEERYLFLKGKIVVSFNGHTVDLQWTEVKDFEEKEKIILTAGRLGTYQKSTETLLEAFRSVAEKSDYSLHLAGTVDPAFTGYVRDYLGANPGLADRVFFHGQLGRQELFRLYGRSRIFCLPSRFDSLPNVFPESMYFRNAVVTTNSVSLKYHIDKFNVGLTFNKENPGELAAAIMMLINDEKHLRDAGERAHEVADTLLNWDNIVMKLHGDINAYINRRTG